MELLQAVIAAGHVRLLHLLSVNTRSAQANIESEINHRCNKINKAKDTSSCSKYYVYTRISWLKSMAHGSFDFKNPIALRLSVNLCRKAFWITVVLYAKRHLVFVGCVQKRIREGLVPWVRFIFKGVDVGFVDCWTHCVADCVVASDASISAIQVAHKIVFCKVFKSLVKLFEILNWFTVYVFKYDCLREGADCLTEVLANTTSC